jgi:DNA-binding GntR family transcriptional regulator
LSAAAPLHGALTFAALSWGDGSSSRAKCTRAKWGGVTELMAEPGAAERVRANSAERVAAAMRRMLLRGELLPGEHVRQEDWAERLGVSRVPVREALKMLAAEHLLVHDPHRGYFVTEMQASEMEQIYRIRRFLEPEILRSIRWPDKAELAVLRGADERCINALRRGDLAEALTQEQQFYFSIYDLSSLSFMIAEVKRLWSIADPYRTAAFAGMMINDPSFDRLRSGHGRILEALVARDVETIVEQVVTGRDRVVQYVRGDNIALQPGT